MRICCYPIFICNFLIFFIKITHNNFIICNSVDFIINASKSFLFFVLGVFFISQTHLSKPLSVCSLDTDFLISFALINLESFI